MTRKIVLSGILYSLLMISLFMAPPAFADAELCGSDPLANLFCQQDLASMLNAAFQVSILLGAVLAMLRIAYGGWLYMGAADMWGNKSTAREIFQNAIIGLLMLLAIYMILFQINPCILKLNLDTTKTCDPKAAAVS